MIQLTEYQQEVLKAIKRNLFEEGAGEKRERKLKDLYLKHYAVDEEQYDFYHHTQTLLKILEKICKQTNQDWTYEQILEHILDEINSTRLGYKRYEGFDVQEIQYMVIISRLAFTTTTEFKEIFEPYEN